MSVLAALIASRNSTPYVFVSARAAAVILSASSPFSPVVTVVICCCLAISALYSVHASVAFAITATLAPMAPVKRAVLDVSNSVMLALIPIFCPMPSIIEPNCPNFPPDNSWFISWSPFCASLMRPFNWSSDCDKALPTGEAFSAADISLYCIENSTKDLFISFSLPVAVLLTVSICPMALTKSSVSFSTTWRVPPALRQPST